MAFFFLEGSETKKNLVDYEMNADFSMDVEEFLDDALLDYQVKAPEMVKEV